MKLLTFASALSLALAAPSCTHAQAQRPAASAGAPAKLGPRQVEKLGRGVVAIVPNPGKVFVSWRLLPSDAPDVAFNVYRVAGSAAPKKINAQPLGGATLFVDEAPELGQSSKYLVRPLANGRELESSQAFTLAATTGTRPYLSIPLRTPPGYTPNDGSVGDLDGDGEYEIVLHQAGRGKDNAQNGETDPPILQAYKLDGTFLWSINLGRNIREGAHYTQFMVFDLDGDGRSEIICKTADGTTDGAGIVIGEAKADWRDASGRILRGPEFLTVFDGLSGKALATEKYVPGRHPQTDNPTGDQMKAVWGDGYGNRGDRFLAGIAYLDGVRPSVVMCRGYYTRTVLAAWDFRGGKLTNRWTFDSDAPGNGKYAGQGNHNLSVADVDNDGRDEIIYGKMTVDDDGRGLYSTGIGHGDAMHVSDLDPSRPGLEVFSIQEPVGDAGVNFFDARTGEVLWKRPSVPRTTGKAEGPGRGLALDIDPRTPGAECWAAGAGLGGILWDARGNVIGDKTPTCNMGVFWDGDPQREILSGTLVEKWDYLGARSTPLLEAGDFGGASNNGTKANPCLSADLLGDWREEIIWRSQDNKELRIFTSPLPTPHRLPTLMSDSTYRLGIAWQNVAYNQPPHLSYDLQSRLAMPTSPTAVVAVAR